jgi:tetratricopeptide (TPR) repeat protein
VALNNYGSATVLLDELIQKFPERESLWTLQANIYVQQEQPKKAIVNLEALRRQNKATPANLNLLGDLYLADDARELALAAYLEAQTKDTGQDARRTIRAGEILASRGAWTEAQSLLAAARDRYGANLSDEDRLALTKLEARIAMGAGDSQKAIALIEQVLLRNPLDGEALIQAGDYYAQAGQRERAESRYKSAADQESHRADAWVKLAQLHVTNKQYPEAIDLLRRAQKLKPRDHVARYLEKVELAAARSSRS